MRTQRSALQRVTAMAVAAAFAAGHAMAQERATVAVDDSPTAIQLLAQAADQAAANPAESARLVRQVLADFGRKLVPSTDDPDRFVDARTVAERLLLSNPEVMRRWRALESAEALRQFAAGDVDSAATQRMLTAGGLEAQLSLADDALVNARFRKALALIDTTAAHPDLAGDAQRRAWRIEALAAWGAGLGARAEAAAARLSAAGGSGADALAALVSTAPPASAEDVNDPLSPQPFGDVSGSPIRLWQESLDQSLKRRTQVSADERQRAPILPESSAEQGKYLVSVPALARGLVIVNEGQRLQALGVFTREPVWSVLMMSPGSPREGQVGDLSAPIVCGDRVLAVSGHSSGGDRDGGIEREGGGRLLCISIDDGRRLWEFQPRWHARSGLEGTFIVGSPAVIEDTVAILLRRVSPRQETISLAAGISLLDGSLRWVAPLGVTPGIRATSTAIRPCATPVALEDSFIVSTGAGVTARLSCIDGRIMWLRRDQVPIRDPRWDLEPWQLQRPAVCGARIMMVDPEQQHVQVLDAADGNQLSLIPIGTGTAWGGTRWLLGSADGTHVLGVGDEVICFACDDLRTPRWSSRAPAGAGPRGERVVGRVQVGTLADGRGAVAIPAGGRVSVRALADGSEIASLDAGAPSNPSLREGLGSLATDDALAMFVDSARTEQFLVRAANAGDPTAIAGLLELAIASSRADLARSASQKATSWLPRDSAVGDADRSELADRVAALLIDVACTGLLSPQESTELFDRVIAREGDPSRRAQALLVQGDWFERSGRLGPAVAVWRRVLAEGSLARSWLPPDSDDSAVVRAGIAARERLAALDPARSGSSARAIDMKPPAAGSSAVAFADFARATACSRESAEAWVAASEAASAAGDRVRAAAAAAMAVDEAIMLRDGALLAEVLDRTLAVLQREALPDSAVRLVDRAVISGMDVPLPSFKGAPASRVRAQMPSSSLVRGEPRVGAPRGSRSAQPLRGEPATMTMRARLTRPTDRFWLVERGGLACISAESLQPLWRVPLAGQSSAIVQHTPAGVVLWEAIDPDRSSLSLIDDAGAPRWSIPDVDSLLSGEPPEQATGPDPVPRFGRESSLRIAGVFPGPADVVLVRSDGAIAAVDSGEGKEMWRSKGVFSEIVDADADDSVVVIAGAGAGESGDGSMRAVAIDRASGRPVAALSDPDIGSVRWVRIVGPGQVAVGHDSGTSRWDLLDDRVSWIRDDPSGRRSLGIDGVVGTFLLHAEGRAPQAIRWRDGGVDPRAFDMLTGRLQRPSEWQDFMRSGDVIVAGDEQGVGLFALDGAQLGATVSIPGRSLHAATPVGAGLVVTEQAGRVDPAVGVGGRARSRLRMQLLGWSDGLKMLGLPASFDVPAQTFGTPIAVDGWIVVPAGKDSSYAVPIPSG